MSIILFLISIFSAYIPVRNAIETKKYADYLEEEFKEERKRKTYAKMNEDIKKAGFVLTKGKWL